jgi:propanol-preferring alcohol dehydrogenase
MKAQRLHRTASASARPLALEDVPRPEPAAGELLVRVAACGVCRTDLHVIEGDLPAAKRPVIPGHMVVGRVEALGAGAPGFSAGDRAGIAWLRSTCGACAFCRSGRENLCEGARFTGYHEDGGYAELAAVPAEFAYRLPEGLDDLRAAPLLCAGIIGYRALKLCGVQPGERLGLWGFGNSAHIVMQVARARGCEVYVSSLRREHQELARAMGAKWVGGAEDSPPVKLHGGIVFAPAGEIVPRALGALERGGTLACAGIHMSPIPAIDYDRELFGERRLCSVTANTRADGRELLAEAARIGLRPEVEAFPLERANEALARLKEGRIRGAAVLRVA